MVAGLDVGDALADGLDDTSTLVSEDDGESALGILAGEGVRVYNSDSELISKRSRVAKRRVCAVPVWQTPV